MRECVKFLTGRILPTGLKSDLKSVPSAEHFPEKTLFSQLADPGKGMRESELYFKTHKGPLDRHRPSSALQLTRVQEASAW
jgi:hypothetical protein